MKSHTKIFWFITFCTEVDGFIRVCDETRYLLLFGLEKYDVDYNRIKYLVSLKSSSTDVIYQNYAKFKVDSYDSLPLEKHWLYMML